MSNGKMPAPAKPRYADQMLSMFRQRLSPVGGFDTSEGSVAHARNVLATKSRLAQMERRVVEQKADIASQSQGFQQAMQQDTTDMRRRLLDMNEDMYREENELGTMGKIAGVSSAIGATYDLSREMQDQAGADSKIGRAVGKFGDVLGQVRPYQQKAWQRKQENEAIRQRILRRQQEAGEVDQTKLEGELALVGRTADTIDEFVEFLMNDVRGHVGNDSWERIRKLIQES